MRLLVDIIESEIDGRIENLKVLLEIRSSYLSMLTVKVISVT